MIDESPDLEQEAFIVNAIHHENLVFNPQTKIK